MSVYNGAGDVYEFLHLEEGLSVYQIAKLVGRSANSIIHTLRYRGVLRTAPGRDIEGKVAVWLEEKGVRVIRARGDWPFDFLANGQRVDVKSAHTTTNGRYYFELSHNAKLKVYGQHIDCFYLVFLDEDDLPVYKVAASECEGIKTLGMKSPEHSKRKLQLVGFLSSGGGERVSI